MAWTLMSVWLFAVGIAAVGLTRYFQWNPVEEFRGFQWEMTLLVAALVVISLYSFGLYSRLPPGLGGGRPVAVTLHLNATPPFLNSPRLDAFLMDENDAGYYLSRTQNGARPFFLPRSIVAGAEFGAASDAPTDVRLGSPD